MRPCIVLEDNSVQANCARESERERPTLRAKSSFIEGMEPEASSREMRSRRFMGKKMVGRPTRSPSGSLICRIKWSKEFKSMPRSVIPEGLIARSSPHTFSLGVWRLTTTIECGSTSPSLPEYRVTYFARLRLWNVSNFPGARLENAETSSQNWPRQQFRQANRVRRLV